MGASPARGLHPVPSGAAAVWPARVELGECSLWERKVKRREPGGLFPFLGAHGPLHPGEEGLSPCTATLEPGDTFGWCPEER